MLSQGRFTTEGTEFTEQGISQAHALWLVAFLCVESSFGLCV